MISSREKKSGLFAHASRGARPLGRTGQWWVTPSTLPWEVCASLSRATTSKCIGGAGGRATA